MTLNYQLVKENKLKLNFPSDLFIDGKYHKSISEKSFDNISPIDGKLINKISFAQHSDIDIAVSSARKVFEKGHWSNMAPGQRKKILLKFSQLIERDRLELSLLDTIDMGKTINDTYNADLPTSIDNIEWYAEIIDKLFDDDLNNCEYSIKAEICTAAIPLCERNDLNNIILEDLEDYYLRNENFKRLTVGYARTVAIGTGTFSSCAGSCNIL